MSPYRLVQERLPRGPLYPWRMLVACVLLNRTRGEVGVPAALEVLRLWPTPLDLGLAQLGQLEDAVRRCGLWRRRAGILRRMSMRYFYEGPRLERLPGVGKYATDSYRIFVLGEHPRGVTDGKLRPYLAWARKNNVRRRRARWRDR